MRIIRSSDITPTTMAGILGMPEDVVSAVTCTMQSSQKGYVSDVASFEITYAIHAPANAPRHVFLKVTKSDLHAEYRSAGEREVAFYTSVLPEHHDLPVAACYFAEWDAGTRHAAVLLADLTQTHVQIALPVAPSPAHCDRIVESLAQIHAAWWNHPQLGRTIGETLSMEAADASRERLEGSVPAFMDYLGDSLLPAQRTAYERILASSFLRRRAHRLHSQQTVCLIHGDVHTNNVMLPRDTTNGRAILIDWQRWGIDVPLYDLAFLIALHWSAERRAWLERPLVRRYYDSLLDRGVTGYTWDDCWNDYRECVIVMALIPIGQFRRRMPAGVIWYGMEQSVAAFNDLGCAELL